MQLKCPDGVASINVAGTEYTAVDGMVDIAEQFHIDAAVANGFTVPADSADQSIIGE